MKPQYLALLAVALCLSSLNAQTAALYVPFGQGCASQGTPPNLSAPKLPIIGQEFIVRARNLQPQTTGVLVFGASNTRWGLFVLPIKIGLCELRVSYDVPVFLSTGSGTAFFISKLPYDSNLVGLRFYNQFLAPDPGAPGSFATSNGASARIGDCICLPPQVVIENFQTDLMLDKPNSGGYWASGRAVPANVGGTGRHGIFDYKLGIKDPTKQIYTWNSDHMVIPATHTESGRAEIVSNGVFEFSSMTLPTGVTVRFTGSNPVQLKVRGNVRIDGHLLVNADDVGFFIAVPIPGRPLAFGQLGSLGGPGGGRGGQGGDSGQNTGPSTTYDGRKGSDVKLANGHAYAAQAIGTGGKGSLHWPRSGRTGSYCALNNVFAGEVAAGGGGGGFITKGIDGVSIDDPCNRGANRGTGLNTGGNLLNLGILSVRNTGPNASLIHYAGGGSGGGGGGSHPLLSRRPPDDKWVPGTGGAGGGGVLAFRVGRDFDMGASATMEVKGGAGYFINGVNNQPGEVGDNLFNVPSPGGGGSGGTVLLQIDAAERLLGTLNASGGKRGVLDNSQAGQPSLTAKSAGGDGAPGYLRLEKPFLPLPSQLGRTIPSATANNVGVLKDIDVKVTSQSKFYSSGLGFSPAFLRYEIEAMVGNKPVVYSDDPNLTHPNFAGPASFGKPVQFRIQGAKIDLTTGTIVKQGPWRDNVRKGAANTLSSDDINGWRWQLVYDRTMTASIVVTKVSIWYQQ